ncbi:N-acetylmuramoyl-L-alanine amidase [Micromonospora sp. NPDC051141]|uniref:golvesin C-terminal-like domain-containing protein n=1 Tax=Micromonospora sp. NPDC051141 TaxID=3364284 RepID=UPI00379087F2
MRVSRRELMRTAIVLGTGAALPGALPQLALPATAGPAARPPTGLAAPVIASCDTWGARTVSGLSQLTSNPDKIVIHHTATANTADLSVTQAYALARSIQAYHMDSLGWSDTGQNFTVSRGGYLMEGRHTSLSHLNSGSGFVTSAHCPGQNTTGVGIENEGTYTSVTPPDTLWNGLVDLCAHICQQWGIAPSQIFGHRDFVATECPGNAFYAKLSQLRQAVQDKLGTPPPTGWSAVVDNASSNFRASTNWSTSSTSTQRYGSDYRYVVPAAVSDAAYFTATLPVTGNYRLEIWHPASTAYHPAAPHVVLASTGTQTVLVNQQSGGGSWRNIGTFTFTAGTRDVLAVSRWTTGTQYVVADALRITQL